LNELYNTPRSGLYEFRFTRRVQILDKDAKASDILNKDVLADVPGEENAPQEEVDGVTQGGSIHSLASVTTAFDTPIQKPVAPLKRSQILVASRDLATFDNWHLLATRFAACRIRLIQPMARRVTRKRVVRSKQVALSHVLLDYAN
jgi:hypothetical protein